MKQTGINKVYATCAEVITGIVRGTEAVHSLPSYLTTDGALFSEHNEDHKRNRLEKIVEGVTVIAEAAGYYMLAQKGLYALPIMTNLVDTVVYFADKLHQHDDCGNPFRGSPSDRVIWGTGGFWSDLIPSLYGDELL